MFGRGAMASTFDAGVQLFGCPRVGRGEYGYSLVSPFAEEGGSRVAEVIESGGQVGAPTEGRDEFLPGTGTF